MTTEIATEVSQVSTPILLLRRVLSITLAAVVLWSVADFPIRTMEILLFLVAVAGAMVYRAHAWLFVLPAAIPVFDLATWSGRFFWDEFDFLVLTVLASAYWSRAYANPLPNLIRRRYLLINLMMLSGVISFCLGMFPLPQLTPHDWYDYLSPVNAWRIGKGMLWAWLLLPLLAESLERDAKSTLAVAAAGVLSGLLFCGAIVLWERGVFAVLVDRPSIYGLLGSILDFTANYRATGWFSSMHTGGTAIDGYLALAVPIAIASFFLTKNDRVRFVIVLVIGCGLYAVAVTFSRGLYGGVGMALAFCIFVTIRRQEVSKRVLIVFGVAVGGLLFLATVMQLLLFNVGGFQALVLGTLLVIAGLVGGHLSQKLSIVYVGAGVFAVALIVSYSIMETIEDSKYVTTVTSDAVLFAGAAFLFLTGPSFFVGRRFLTSENFLYGMTLLAFFGALWVIALPAASGYRMIDRFAAVEKDLTTREGHWSIGLAAMPFDIVSIIFGAGSGSFPRNYLFYLAQQGAVEQSRESLKSFRFKRDAQYGSYLSLGTGGYNMQQRVDVKPNRDYKLGIQARTAEGRSGISLALCEKNLIISERSQLTCVKKEFRWHSDGSAKSLVWEIQSGELGRSGIAYWPVTFVMHNGNRQKTLDVTDIRLEAGDGSNLISNGEFTAAGDHWFFVSDFEHLAWHPKNIFLFIFHEQGLFGVVVFLVLVITALLRNFRKVTDEDLLPTVVFATLLSLVGVGLFGTILDTSKVATFAYLILFVGVAPFEQNKMAKTAQTKKKHRRKPESLPTEERTTRQKIRLHADQLEFVNSLAIELKSSTSETIQTMLDLVLEELNSSPIEASDRVDLNSLTRLLSGQEPQSSRSKPRLNDRMRSLNANLRQDQLDLLTPYTKALNVSLSRSIRRLVGYFILLHEREDKTSGDDLVERNTSENGTDSQT